MNNSYTKRKGFIWLAILPLFAMACGILTPLDITVGRQPSRPSAADPTQVFQQPTQEASAPQEPVNPAPTWAQPAIAPASLPAVSGNDDQVLEALYQAADPAVVSIIVYAADQSGALAAAGQGSGFVIDTDGHIVTNAHVVHGADSVDIVFPDDTTLSGKVLGEDLHADLAVVKVDKLPAGVNPLPLGDINQVKVGQTVAAIGNPFGLGGTLTRGIVSALGRTIPALTSFSIPQAIQTDAPINPGNSGGPLLNLQGQVIGVNAQIETGGASRSNSGIGFAIPVSIVAKTVPNLIAHGKMEWSWMGVAGYSLNSLLIKAMNLPVQKGAYIDDVVSNGPADKAGLRGSTDKATVDHRVLKVGGDVIVAINGQPITSFDDMLLYMTLNTQPGQKVTVTIIRNGKQQDIGVTLEPRPQQSPGSVQPNTPPFPFPFPNQP